MSFMDMTTKIDVLVLIDELLEIGQTDVSQIAATIAAQVSDRQKIDEWDRQLVVRVSARAGVKRRRPWASDDQERVIRALAETRARRNGSQQIQHDFITKHADLLVQRELRQLIHVPSLGRYVFRGQVTKEQQAEVVDVRVKNAARHATWADFERRLLEVTPVGGTVADVATGTLRELFLAKPQS